MWRATPRDDPLKCPSTMRSVTWSKPTECEGRFGGAPCWPDGLHGRAPGRSEARYGGTKRPCVEVWFLMWRSPTPPWSRSGPSRPGPAAGRVHRQGPHDDRATPRRLRRPPGRLRPPQNPWQTAHPKPGRSGRYHVPADAARIITALLTLREHVIAPILAGVRSPAPAADRPTGPPSTATTKPSASTCTPSSTTSASPPPLQPHRQLLVDPIRQAPRTIHSMGDLGAEVR